MKLSTNLKAAILVAGLLPTTLGPIGTAVAANDPTAGRIQNRVAENRAQYHRCAKFALTVYRAGLEQAGNNSAKVRAARAHYHANLARCRALLS